MANGARRLQGVGSLLCGVVLLDGVLGAQVGEAATYYVATTGSDSNTCVQAQSPSTPKQTINAALNCLGTAAGAGAGHTVQVAPGTYAETIDNNLPGGTSWSAPFTLEAATIGTVTLQPPPGALRCMLIARATSQYAIISGIVCDGVNTSSDGIKITASSTSGAASFIRLRDVEVQRAMHQGILITHSTDNEIIRATVHDNGTEDNLDHGIYAAIAAHRTLIRHSRFYNNHAYGITVYNATTPPDGCIVRNNRSYQNGTGGLVIWATNSLVYNNLIYNNHTAAGNLLESPKAGILVGGLSNGVKIYNNTVYGQKANAGDTGIKVSEGAVDTEVMNNIVFNNAKNITNKGTGTILAANLTSDPKFVNAAAANFALQLGSPAIDMGETLSAVPRDYAGVSRPQGPAYDIGAYEYVY